MKLDDLKNEFGELWEDVKVNTRRSTSEYRGDRNNYENNKKKAAVGILGGAVALTFVPIVGLAALGYGGVKAYQAYKDKKNGGRQ